jgi:hypothetical protein
MDIKSKIIFIVLVIGIAISVWQTYDRIYVERDYMISAEIDCDPEVNSCYVWVDEEGEYGEVGEVWYYALISKKASSFSICNPHREECEDELYCADDEEDCEVYYCEPEEVGDGEECAGPGLILE